jgi:hypothetical protein
VRLRGAHWFVLCGSGNVSPALTRQRAAHNGSLGGILALAAPLASS